MLFSSFSLSLPLKNLILLKNLTLSLIKSFSILFVSFTYPFLYINGRDINGIRTLSVELV